MRSVPEHGEQLLNEAMNCTFSRPVTAYLTADSTLTRTPIPRTSGQ